MLDSTSNPYRPPPIADGDAVVFCDRSKRPAMEEPIESFELPRVGREPATRIEFYVDRLVVDRGESKPLVLMTRAAFAEHCELVLGVLLRGFVVVGEVERFMVTLSLEALRGLRRWLEPTLGRVLMRHFAVRRRFDLTLGVGTALVSLPLGPMRFNPSMLAWGTAVVALSLLAQRVKHRALLLGEGAVWLLMCFTNLAMAFQRESWFTASLGLLGLFFAIGSLYRFRFFGRALPVDMPPGL